tara:strand:- start:667 stop:933 length:267 start_codon:yes stop_codon:yes gene_type:complete
MNLMIIASCKSSIDFKKNVYDLVKSEFADWCDNEKSVFSIIDEQNVLELFFDINPVKLKEWLEKPSTQEIVKKHNFVPKRYSFEPLEI